MIRLLKDPREQYDLYQLGFNDEAEYDLMSLEKYAKQKCSYVEPAYHLYKQHKNDDPLTLEQFVKKKYTCIEEKYHSYKGDNQNSVMILEKFFNQRFSFIGEKLKVYM